jgi:signal transduction histidine kinase
VWLTDILADPEIRRSGVATSSGLFSAFAFPIQTGADFFGVLEFFTTRRLEPDPTITNMMMAIASEIGQFIQRRSAEDALRRAHDELEARVQQRTVDLKLANAKLAAAIAERQRLEHELLDITEKERRRIGLDLHDDLGQKLSGIALMTKGLELRLIKESAGSAQDAAKIHALVQEAMSHASDLAHDMATLDVSETDLSSALESLASHARGLFGTSCRFKGNGQIPPLPHESVKQLYKIAQEAVTNAIKHGKAKRVTISLSTKDGKIVMRIQNTGLPFPDLSSRTTGMGLRIMNYRANLVGGTLEIKGTGMNGTMVICTLPIPETAASTAPTPLQQASANKS